MFGGTAIRSVNAKRGGIFWHVVTPDYGTRLQPREVIWLEVEWSLQKFHRREPLSSLISKFRESLLVPTPLPPFYSPLKKTGKEKSENHTASPRQALLVRRIFRESR